MAQPALVTAATSGMGKKNKEMSRSIRRCICMAVFLCITSVVVLAMQLIAQVVSLDPAKMPAIGTVDERFQSYNIEMVEVIGGRFWKPYRDIDALLKAQSSFTQSSKDAAAVPAGMDPNLYQQHPPIDLTNPRLRKLAAALGPAYVRVSGTWANTAYFHNSDQPAPKTPPKGFGG